jgi:putative endonuclease
MKIYAVYMMTNRSRTTLYAGMTNDLQRRVGQHKAQKTPGFSRKYRTTILVYVETFQDVKQAIAREKQIKGIRRAKKDALINVLNPEWRDLAAEILVN